MYNILVDVITHEGRYNPLWLDKLQIPCIREMGFRTYTSSVDLGFHRNDGYELVYVLSGHYRWELGSGEILDVRGNQASLTRPETMHRGHIDHISPGTILYIVFRPESESFRELCGISPEEQRMITDLLISHGDAIHRTSKQFRNHISNLVHEIQREKQTGFDYSLLRHGIIHTLMLFISDLRSSRGESEASPLLGLYSYIEEHISEPLPVSVLTEVSGWSRSQLYALFSKYAGQSPNDYIQSVRCDAARELLNTTSLPVTHIALDLGFSSSQYFSRVFRKYTGLTPTDYRERFRN